MNGKNPCSRPTLIYDDDGSCLKECRVLMQSSYNQAFQVLWCYVLSSHLNYTRPFCLSYGQQHTKIQVVSKHHILILPCPVHDNTICSTRFTNHSPMSSLPPVALEYGDPERGKVHVNEELHA